MNQHNDEIISHRVHIESSINGMQIEAAFYIIGQQNVEWHLHAYLPVLIEHQALKKEKKLKIKTTYHPK